MAKTLTAGQALDLFAVRQPRILTDGWGARFCDEVLGKIWHAYPWRETLATLPPFYLQKGEAWYGPPLQTVPSDFFGLHDAWLRSSTGDVRELLVQRNLRPTQAEGTPTTITYDGSRSSFMVHPASSLATPDWWVEGVYKKTPTKITQANLMSYTLPWDDTYFDVFRAGLDWKLKAFSGDRDNLMAKQSFSLMIDDMARQEGFATGTLAVAPQDSLELGG